MLFIIIGAVLALAAAVAVWRAAVLRPGRRVVVNIDEHVWSGTLVRASRRSIVLRDVTIGIEDRARKADGRTVLPRDRVYFVQVLD